MRTAALALLVLAARGGQEKGRAEPPCRLDFEKAALERSGERLTLTLEARSDLPPGAIVEVVISLTVDVYDDKAREMAARRLEPPLRRTARLEGTAGKTSFRLLQAFPRAGEAVIEATFDPEHALQEKAALQRALKENCRPMKWERKLLLGSYESRLEALSRWTPDRELVLDGEKIVTRLGKLAEARSEAAKASGSERACADLNELFSKLDPAIRQTPFPAGLEYARRVLGEAATYGSILASASGRKAEESKEAQLDGGDLKGEADAKNLPAEIVVGFLRPLSRSREILAREYALGVALELARMQADAAAALAEEAPDERSRARLRLAIARGKTAARKAHEQGLARIGDPYRALFAGVPKPETFFDGALGRLDRVAASLERPAAGEGALAEECKRGRNEFEESVKEWRRFEK